MPRIGIVAGEASGDLLGGDLISALKLEIPDIEFTGIGGDNMRKAGCDCIYPTEKLSVMGISEVFGRYLELRNIQNSIKNVFLDNPPDLFIGIDAPDFNFPLEKKLRQHGIKTVHYVSPSIWAWREYRLRSIAKSVDLMLTLFPFEPVFYQKYDIPVKFVGHPLANKIDIKTDKLIKRKQLGLPENKNIVAIMPGSRGSELKKLAAPFLQTASLCHQQFGGLCFISNLVNDDDKNYVEALAKQIVPEINIMFYTGKALDVMGAADVVLLASGTAALEAMLLKRPMVVAYKVNWLTYQLAKWLIRLPYVSLPNVLAGRKLVPEYLQDECEPEIMSGELIQLIKNKERVAELEIEFIRLHESIRSSPESSLSKVILGFMNEIG